MNFAFPVLGNPRLIFLPSAGAVHTPQVGNVLCSTLESDVGTQILLLSGIGPAAQLAFHGISPQVDLPGVGEHLMDHPAVNMNLLDKSGHSLGWMRKAGPLNLKLLSAVLQWVRAGSGPLTTNVSGYTTRHLIVTHGVHACHFRNIVCRGNSIHPRR